MIGFGPTVWHGNRFRTLAEMSFLAALAGLGWRRGLRARAAGSYSAAALCAFAAGNHEECGGAVHSAAADGADRRLQRAVEKGRGHVRPAVGTQSGAAPALQARREIVHSQAER